VSTEQTTAICRASIPLAGRRGGVESALRRGLSCQAGCSDERQLNQSWLKAGRWFFFPLTFLLPFLLTPVFVTGDSPCSPACPTANPAGEKPLPRPEGAVEMMHTTSKSQELSITRSPHLGQRVAAGMTHTTSKSQELSITRSPHLGQRVAAGMMHAAPKSQELSITCVL